MKAVFIFAFILLVIGGLAAFYFMNNVEEGSDVSGADVLSGVASVKVKESAEEDLAIAKAKELWRARFLSGEDLSAGPCLSDELIKDWVGDIAHSPRQDVDNDPANQCAAYRDGRANHFVELDPSGNLIRAE